MLNFLKKTGCKLKKSPSTNFNDLESEISLSISELSGFWEEISGWLIHYQKTNMLNNTQSIS